MKHIDIRKKLGFVLGGVVVLLLLTLGTGAALSLFDSAWENWIEPSPSAIKHTISALERPQQIASNTQREADDVRFAQNKPQENRGILDNKDKDKKEIQPDENSEEKDYWGDVDFDPDEFDKLRYYVKRHYIEPYIDEKMALIEAASMALYTLKEHRELLPVEFYNARKDNPDEEDKLTGKIYKLDPKHHYLVHIIPKKDDEKKPAKRLTDEEKLALRTKARERNRFLRQCWGKITFDDAAFSEVMQHVEKLGKADEKFSVKEAWIAAAQGYLYSLDPHSSIISAKAWEESTRQATDSSFEGIGAILTQRPIKGKYFTLVESPLEDRPAVKAGLRSGDIILKVDSKDIIDMPLRDVVARIRGKKGTTVVLTIQREGEPDDLLIPIVREYIEIKNVRGELLKHYDDIAYIKLTGFVPVSSRELRKMINKLTLATKSQKLRGIVFDLRNNSGGLLDQSVEIADYFLDSGIIVTTKSRLQDDDIKYAHEYNTIDTPLVVLVNDQSASASEIVASAIQDNKRGLVLGERTFGKASVQNLVLNRAGSGEYYIKLTIARYYAPSGRTIQVIGVCPDIEIAPDVGQPIPLGYREEDLFNHLAPLNNSYKSPNATIRDKVLSCDKENGKAEKLYAADPNPQIKFDYQLAKAADYLECLIRINKGENY